MVIGVLYEYTDSAFPADEVLFFSKISNNLPDLTVSLPLDHNMQYIQRLFKFLSRFKLVKLFKCDIRQGSTSCIGSFIILTDFSACWHVDRFTQPVDFNK
jgi:hypothetical protein